MKKHNKEYFIYGLNNSISLLSSKKYTINSIIMMKDSIAESNEALYKYLENNKSIITKLNKKDFLSKYDYKHTQGVLIFFSGTIAILVIREPAIDEALERAVLRTPAESIIPFSIIST